MAVNTFGFENILRKLGGSRGGGKANMDTRILRALKLIGEDMCNAARDTYKGGNPDLGTSHQDGGYDDHTRNLRGSIGYRIFFNGKEMETGGLDGRGSDTGESAAKEALGKVKLEGKLWEIHIVAGMHYARYVEAKGFPVITFVQSMLDEQMADLVARIKKGEL